MKLKESLEKNKFVVTSEVQAPSEEAPEDFVDALTKIRGRIDGVSITEVEFEGMIGDSIKACDILKKHRFEPIYQTTTRDKNRIQLQKDLKNAHEAGVENLLVFTEDYRITGDSLQEMMFFHVDSGKLGSVLEHMKGGQTIDGHDLSSKVDFVIGSGIESGWGKNIPDLEKKEMEVMTELGTGYFLTTPIFNVELFEKFIKEAKVFGVPVIAEIMIIRTAGMAQFLNRHLRSGMVPDWIIQKLSKAPDKLKASIEIFTEIVNGLKDICQGVHIITIGGEDKLKHYLDAAKLK